MNEEWRKVPSNQDYEVSNLGRVRSLDKKVYAGRNSYRAVVGKVLKPGLASNGYWTVVLGRAMGSRTVHSLVAEAFLGPCPTGQEVRHLDGVRTNCNADNLAYGTRLDNINDAFGHGTRNTEGYRALGLKGAATKDERYGRGWRSKVFIPGGFA
jgi:hypothetical protein